MSIGNKFSLQIISVFCIFAVVFILFQHHREKEFKIERLNTQLQDYNEQLCQSLTAAGDHSEPAIASFERRHHMPGLRLTLISEQGYVLYDNTRKDYGDMGNHLQRKEVQEALTQGNGFDIDRRSASTGKEYFYSASYFPKQHYIVRSALPYDHTLTEALQAEQRYIWVALVIVALLSFLLFRFGKRLDRNINQLRIFAQRAAANESLDVEDLAEFPGDELGEIAERIIKIYRRLQYTKEEQNRLKHELIQNAAHELKTPVASIQGYIETILTDTNMTDENRQLFLERSFAQTQRLTAILQDISTLHRLDSGTIAYEFEPVDIYETVSHIQQETALQLSGRRMTFVNQLPSPLIVRGNASLLYSIFRNLTDNAIAYAGDGTTITLTARQTGDYWHFCFSDNGVGIPQEHLMRIFERFYRVDKGRSRKMGGTGLGLAIVKNAVIMHGGTITACRNEGSGVRFVFDIHC